MDGDAQQAVVAALKAYGPLLSDALVQHLLEAKAASNAAQARKLMSRATAAKLVRTSDPLRFDTAYLYFLDSHRGSGYANVVRQALKLKPNYNRVFKSILPCKEENVVSSNARDEDSEWKRARRRFGDISRNGVRPPRMSMA